MTESAIDKLKKHPVYVGLGVAELVLAAPLAVIAYFGIAPVAGIGAAVVAIGLPGLIYWSMKSRDVEEPRDEPAPPRKPIPQQAWKLDNRFHIPPDAHAGQNLFREAFEAMRPGQMAEVATEVAEWVNKQCYLICEAYPGIERADLKDRFYELAFNWIKRGWMFDEATAAVVIPLVESHLYSRFGKGL